MIAKRILATGAIGACALLSLAGPASADSLTLSCELLGPNNTPSCQTTSVPMYSVPGEYAYGFGVPADGGSFSGSEGSTPITGASINNSDPGFVDGYFFQIGPASADSISSTIDLGNTWGVSELFERIYSLSATENSPGLVLGNPQGTVYDAAVTQLGSGTVTVIDPVTLGQGSYVLEMSGLTTGTNGGEFQGTLNLATVVPLPPSFALLLSGLLGFAGLILPRSRDR